MKYNDKENPDCDYFSPCGLVSCSGCAPALVRPAHPSRPVKELTIPLPLWSYHGDKGEVVSTMGNDVIDSGRKCSVSVGAASDMRFNSAVSDAWATKNLRPLIEAKRKRRSNARLARSIRLAGLTKQQLGADVSTTTSRGKVRNRSDNRFQCLSDEESLDCRFAVRLRRKAESLVKFFGIELGIKGDVGLLPPLIECGHLRSAVRGCFPSELAPLQELSFKTAQKAEKSCCKVCKPIFRKRLSDWKEALKQPVSIDDEHLERFKTALRMNVPTGWNSIPGPYIPNGSATLQHSVGEGGNWNEEEFSSRCRAALVFSSGKPRVVTCYSSYNTEVLTPLHESLYKKLGRLGWLLVGDPTVDRVAGLNGDGDFLSFDYVGATDSIKSAYVRAAIEILVDKGEGLSEDEVRCLRVLGDLRVYIPEGDEDEPMNYYECFNRGQPMGSSMSFPLLCLINKTVVDLALLDLLESRKISFKEWVEHRCLINGDDLLTREPGAKTDLKGAITYHGACVGLVVNEEKSMKSAVLAEINSTLFSAKGGKKEMKTNANALYMKADVCDVLGLARDATVTEAGFKKVVRANARLLARQEDKLLWKLPYPLQRLCRKDRKIRKALFMQPVEKRPHIANIFPVVSRPDGYDLSHEEEVAILRDRVKEIRNDGKELAIAKSATERTFRTSVVHVDRSWRSLLKRKKPGGETVLAVLDRAYKTKEKNRLVEEEALAASRREEVLGNWFDTHDSSMYSSKIDYLTDAIRSLREGRDKPRPERKLTPASSTAYVVDSEVVTVEGLPLDSVIQKRIWDLSVLGVSFRTFSEQMRCFDKAWTSGAN